MKLRKILIVPAVLLIAAAALPLAWRGEMNAMTAQMQDSLKSYGFADPRIENITYDNGRAVFTGITLDRDGFSTIRAIQLDAGPLDILLRREITSAVIDGVKLTGSYRGETGLVVSGWKKQLLPLPPWQDTLLTGGQIDLDTPAGALRLQAKGQALRQPGNELKLQSLVWGVQNQLKIDSELNGTVKPDGGWSYDFKLRDGAVNFERVQGSRMSGWLTVTKPAPDAIPQLSGQLDAGKMNIGDLAFSNFRLTVEGPYNGYKLLAKGEVYGYEKMLASLDLAYSITGPVVNASVETAKLEDMISFLAALRNSDTKTGDVTTLLLTKGNLERLRHEISDMKYDLLEVQISGPVYDLLGKVIVKSYQDGVEQRHVISLDPGNG